MAHEITETDQMFSVRQPTWHGLGVILSDYPTREEAQQLAHPWEPVSEPVYRLYESDPVELYEKIEGSKLNVRSDSRAPLGVVNDSLETIGNGEMYDVAEAIEGDASGSVMFETAGSLAGGKRVWVLVRLREPLKVPGDPHGDTLAYYAIQNAHDGSAGARGQGTMCRIQCANTSKIADIDAKAHGTEFLFRHTKNVHERIEQAKQALAGWRVSLQDWQDATARLIELGITPDQQEKFIRVFIPEPPPHMASDRVMNNVEKARKQLWAILNGPTCEGIANTAYGLVQASVEYSEHERAARSQESRFKRQWLERSTITADAVKIAVKVAG